nr:RNA-directed DNA polymerase, eukaryota, reverse transcriptase zinc-binding domain protein [Tanacetum cinerariifolium]
MRESHYDYGPTPFKFYHYWFEFDGFEKFVEDSWKEIRVTDMNDYVNFMKKLRILKEKNKTWIRSYKEHTYGRMSILKSELINLDSVFDKGGGVEKDVHRRHEIVYRELTDRISSDQAVDLESAVSKEEIKRAVWDSGIDKSLGPDGFTFGFYRRYWNLIEGDVVNAVTWFFHHGRIPNGGNSSFITLIPKIPNANMVKDFRPISLIGSVYKIVAKVLANRLVMVLGNLVSDTQSAFVKDRQILDGPFILNELWNQANIDTITRVLDVFHRAPGLRINMNNSKLMGISVESSKVEQAVEKIRCMALKMPFKYLGSKVGDLMSRTISWNEVLECMVVWLSRWKLKTISIGWRLTLLKSVLGSIPIYHTSMFKVPKTVLQTMEAIRARAFMFKWVWRFITKKKSLWARVIKAIHDDGGKIGKKVN